MVWGCVEEPIKLYIEGLHSGMGLMCGGLTGFVRTIYAAETTIAKFTPADYVISATIASAWKRSTSPAGDILFYNCTESDKTPLTWRKFLELSKDDMLKYPPYEKLLWYPRISMTSNYTWYIIAVTLFQIIPSSVMDLVLLASGKKPL